MAQGGWVVLIWQEGGMGSITSTILPHQRRAGGERRCSKPAGREEGRRSNSERIRERGSSSESSSLITLMRDSMSIGNIRHKIPYFLFSLIRSEKAFILVFLPGYKEGIIFFKCIRSIIWQSNWILQLSYNGVEICIFHFTNQESFCSIQYFNIGFFFYFRHNLWFLYLDQSYGLCNGKAL